MAALIANPPVGFRRVVKDRFYVGLDLGQSVDPSALSVLHHTHHTDLRLDGVVKPVGERYAIRHIERLPLGMPYPSQIAYVKQVLAREPLASANAELVLDESSIGRPVADMFDQAGLRPTRVLITAGQDRATQHGLRRWHVPKGILVSLLDAKLNNEELTFAPELLEAGALAEELQDFQRHVSASGRFQYSARETKHDDMVMSIGIALFAAAGRPTPPVAAFGVYGTSPDAITYGVKS